jgi:hypothetical protein
MSSRVVVEAALRQAAKVAMRLTSKMAISGQSVVTVVLTEGSDTGCVQTSLSSKDPKRLAAMLRKMADKLESGRWG